MPNNRAPDLSLIVPCYNEEECLESTMPPLAEAFRKAGVDLELVLVDNGSADRTSAVIDRLIERGLPARKASVKVNRGWGLGVKTGLQDCGGRYIGTLCADGQRCGKSCFWNRFGPAGRRLGGYGNKGILARPRGELLGAC